MSKVLVCFDNTTRIIATALEVGDMEGEPAGRIFRNADDTLEFVHRLGMGKFLQKRQKDG